MITFKSLIEQDNQYDAEESMMLNHLETTYDYPLVKYALQFANKHSLRKPIKQKLYRGCRWDDIHNPAVKNVARKYSSYTETVGWQTEEALRSWTYSFDTALEFTKCMDEETHAIVIALIPTADEVILDFTQWDKYQTSQYGIKTGSNEQEVLLLVNPGRTVEIVKVVK